MKTGKIYLNIKVLITIFSLVLFFNQINYAQTTFYVSTSGNDSNNGTSQSSPWKTINKINNYNISPGTKILFKRGDTWSNSSLNITRSGTSSSNIFFGAYGSGNKPIIIAGNSNSTGIRITGKYIQLDNLYFKGWPTGNGYNTYPQGISIIGSNVTVQNCTVEGNINGNTTNTVGIYIQGLYAEVTDNEVMYWGRLIQVQPVIASPCNILISNNKLHDTRPLGFNDGDGIKIASSSGDTRGLVISHNEFYGWSNDGVDGRGKYITVEYNEFHNPQYMVNSGIAFKRMTGVVEQSLGSIARYNIIRDWNAHNPLFTGGGTIVTGSSEQQIYYNLIYNIFGHHGISKDMVSHDVEIYNNTLFNVGGTDRHALNFQSNSKGSSNIKLRNNILGGKGGSSYDVFFGCNVTSTNNVYVRNNIKVRSGVSVSQNNNTSGTPSFVNSSSGNYRLSSSDTKAKNKGVLLSGIPLLDLDGGLVPFGLSPDIGAFEFGASGSGGSGGGDTTPPELLSVEINSSAKITLTFSEELEPIVANNKNNYSINNSVSVSSAILSSDGESVVLNTSSHSGGNYIVTVVNIEDLAGNEITSSGNSLGYMYNATAVSFVVRAKVYLQGSFGGTGMSNYLNRANYLPDHQPYNNAPWNYNGTETKANPPSGVVDWVLIELRSGTSASSTVVRRAAFIKNGGYLEDLDAESGVKISGIPPGDYYLVIKHRNHLAVMSSSKISFPTVSTYDFTSSLSKSYGSGQVSLDGGKYGMYAGDGDGNGIINNNDINNVWNPQNGNTGYYEGDFDMNGGVNISDKNLKWQPNSGKSSEVPD